MFITDKINEIIDRRISRNGFEVIDNFISVPLKWDEFKY